MKRIYQRCCGIDVHKATLAACVRVYTRGGKLSQEIRSFGTTSAELLSLHDWLSAQQVSHVAMEATGVYWKPVYYVLEHGFTVLLVNPAEIKRLPGRKTDVSDSAWLAQLLENGLLRPALFHRARSVSCAIWCATAPSSSMTIREWPTAYTRCCRTPTSNSPV
jgi:transposase